MEISIDQIRLWNTRALADGVGGITPFAHRLGKSQSQVSQLIGLRPVKPIGKNLAYEIAAAFDHSKGWMDTPHPENWKRIANPDWVPQLQAVLATLEKTRMTISSGGASGDSPHAVPSSLPGLRRLPVLHWADFAVTGARNIREGEDYMAVPCETGPKGFILQVEGDAMAPDYPAGGYIIIDPDVEVRNQDDVVALGEGTDAPVFRRYAVEGGQALLLAVNPRYPTLRADEILGCVVGYYRPVRR